MLVSLECVVLIAMFFLCVHISFVEFCFWFARQGKQWQNTLFDSFESADFGRGAEWNAGVVCKQKGWVLLGAGRQAFIIITRITLFIFYIWVVHRRLHLRYWFLMYGRLVVSNWSDFRVFVLLFVVSYLRLVLFRFLIYQLCRCSCWLLRRGIKEQQSERDSAGEMDRRVKGFPSHPRRNEGWQFTAGFKLFLRIVVFVHMVRSTSPGGRNWKIEGRSGIWAKTTVFRHFDICFAFPIISHGHFRIL
jgi:hypothetical protein